MEYLHVFFTAFFPEKEQARRFRQSLNDPGHVNDPPQPDRRYELDGSGSRFRAFRIHNAYRNRL
jgi:hypothetical protein